MRAVWILAIAGLIIISVWQFASALQTPPSIPSLGIGLVVSCAIIAVLAVVRNKPRGSSSEVGPLPTEGEPAAGGVLDFLESIDKRLGFHRPKRFEFELGGKPAAIEREYWTGRLALIVGSEVFELRKRYRVVPDPFQKRWSLQIDGHEVTVESEAKPAGPSVLYRVIVDGSKVAEIRL